MSTFHNSFPGREISSATLPTPPPHKPCHRDPLTCLASPQKRGLILIVRWRSNPEFLFLILSDNPAQNTHVASSSAWTPSGTCLPPPRPPRASPWTTPGGTPGSWPRAWGAASRTCTWLRGPRGSAQGSRARGPWARPSPTCARTFWSAARRPEFHVDLLLFWLQLFRHLQAHMLTKNEENIEQLVVLQIKRVNLIRDS